MVKLLDNFDEELAKQDDYMRDYSKGIIDKVNFSYDEDELREKILYKRIVDWNKYSLILEDGTVITLYLSLQECCSYAEGDFRDVVLDAVITDISKSEEFVDENGHARTTVTVYHNLNPVATADLLCTAGDSLCYYSVVSLEVSGVHYPVLTYNLFH